ATDFPRGGAKTLTALEVRELREQAEKDFEAGIPLDSDEELNTEHSKKRKRKSEKILKSNKKEKLFLNTKPNSIISTLTFKKLSVGMTLLGVVKEINDLDLVISLPNQLTGFVAITEISDFITEKVENAAKIEEEEDLEDSIPDLRELFEVGEYVVCAIINLENTTAAKKRVELSLNPKIVNISLKAPDISAGMNLMGTILSEEDHGYIIDLGIENSAGFLNKKGIEGQSKKFKDGAFKVGQLLLSQVSKVEQGSKIIKLTVENESLKKNVISSTEKISFESLKPGFLIQGKVKESNENGIIVSFHDLFHGTVDVFHVGHLVQNIEVDLEQKFKEGQKLKCRIIYVDEAKKRIGLSLNSNILHLSVDPLSADINKQVGSKLALRVIRIEHGKGVILASEDDTCVCYAHKSRISDNSDYKFEDKKFKIGSIQEARIIALNPFDNIYSVSLQKSVLDQTFFQLKDITVGVVVKAKILRLTAKGIVCSVTDSINGFIPKLHMSDVLLCDPSERRLILTHKKSLLNSKLPKLVNYNDITEGTITCGVINSITNFGCFISFFGSVSGFAHISELSEDFLKHPAEMFKIGQTVKCKVLGKTDDKLRLTLKISQNSVPFIKSLHSGQIVSGTIISKTNQCFVIKLKDTGCKGVLPFKHLSDHNSESHISKLADALKEGMMLEKLVVMEINKLSGEILLSKKPTLIHYANEKGSELLIDVNALEPSLTIPGFVKKILDKGCIIGFVGGLQGFAKMHSISDRFVANISEHVSLNQTVLATISSVDKENGKFFVDLKNSLNFPNAFSVKPNNYEIEFLNSLFVEKDFIFPSTTSSSCMKFGDPIKVSVKQIVPYGVIVNIPSNEALSGLITTYQTFGKVLKVGEDILARVLDIDWEKKIVDLSLNHVVPLTGNTKKLQQAYESFKVLDAQIEVIKEDYLVASLTSLENLLCFVSVKTLNSVETPFSKFKSGQNIKVIITKLPEKISGTLHAERLLAVVRESKSVNNEKFEFRKKLKNSVDSKIEYLDDVVIGLSLKGKVKSVKTTQINVELAGNLFGRVHLFEIPQPHNETSNKTHPFKGIRQGDVIDCKVIGFRDTKTHNYLPITKKTSPQFLIVDLTMKQADLDLPDLQLTCVGDSRYIQFNTINIGDEISGFVQRVEKDAVWCQISPNLQGRCFILECSEKIKILENLANNFKEGQSIRCTVIAKDNVKNSVDLTFKDESMRSLQVEKIVPGIISDIKKESGLTVQLGARSYGRVHLTDIRDKFTDNPTKGFIKGELVNCFILNKTDDKIDLSLRPSRLVRNKTKKTDSVNREIKSINDLVVGELCEGYIKNISDGGVFVSVNRNLSGRVQIRNLSDLYIKDWKNLFQKGQFVKGKIIE
ncbi:Protein RRP5, partial [Clydaea vesicula]